MIYNFYIDGELVDIRRLADDKEAVYQARNLAELHEGEFITCMTNKGLVARACMMIWRAHDEYQEKNYN